MRSFAFARWLAVPAVLVLAACPKATEPAKVPTTVTVTPGTVNLANLDLTQQLTARVKDQNGDSLPGATVAWSSSNTAVATVSASGLVTATGAGTVTITATSGTASGQANVTVVVPPASIAKAAISGDAQSGAVTTTLANPLVVIVKNIHGDPLANVPVTFAVTAGTGSLSPTTPTTGADGQASTSLTLGGALGARTIRATVSGLTPVTFTATGIAGPAANVVVQAGNNQLAAAGATLPVPPTVRVTDAGGNPKQGITVTFAVTAGGGSVTGATTTTNASGDATVGSWTLGASGVNTLSATVAGAGITGNPATISATASATSGTTALQIVLGDGQSGLVGYALNIRPAVKAVTGTGIPVAGDVITFTVTGGGGSVTSATATTNGAGIAQVADWVLGAAAGPNTLSATRAGATGVNFTATGQVSGFDVTVRNVGPPFDPAVQTAFDSAVAFWERAIIGDLSDITVNLSGVCSFGVTLNETVDDILILASFDSIDGPLGILGSAGDCGLLRNSNGLAVVGQMRFDSADVAFMVTNGILNTVIRHEMGHVLGFTSGRFDLTLSGGFTRDCVDLLTTGSPPNVNSQDTHFTCPLALAMFDSIGGTTYTGGLKVPLENCVGTANPCGPGNYNGHWREGVFGAEMMTPYISVGANPASRLTIALFEDMGYQVNYAAAEAYVQAFTAPAATRGMRIDLGNDVMVAPTVRVLYDGPPVRGAPRR